jgi:hypothetical protein
MSDRIDHRERWAESNARIERAVDDLVIKR